jgi:quercetin dioxygenase-like cupin family protein
VPRLRPPVDPRALRLRVDPVYVSGVTVIHRGPGEGESVRNPVGGLVTFRLRGEESGGALTIVESVAAPGEGPPLHRHDDADEVLQVLEGEFRFQLGDEVKPAPAGTLVYVTRGVTHTWQNVGDVPGRLLAMFTPASIGMETFFERFAPVADGPSPMESFKALAGDAGMEVVGPPLSALSS